MLCNLLDHALAQRNVEAITSQHNLAQSKRAVQNPKLHKLKIQDIDLCTLLVLQQKHRQRLPRMVIPHAHDSTSSSILLVAARAPCDVFDPWVRWERSQVGISEFVRVRRRPEIWEPGNLGFGDLGTWKSINLESEK